MSTNRPQTDSRGPCVLSVSPSVSGGGAERVALSLHERYLGAGLESWLAVSNVNAPARHLLRIPVDARRGTWARTLLAPARAMESRSRAAGDPAWYAARALRLSAEPARWARVMQGHEDFDFPWTPGLPDLSPEPPDVLHLHNLHGGYFDVRALPELTTRVPTVITLHDTWLLTGHCAQPFECDRWRTGCGSCPDLDRYVPVRGEKTADNREVKRRAVLASRLGIASPSKWLLEMVEQSGLLGDGREGRVIPNGVDTAVFSPGSREGARDALGLPLDARMVVMSAKGARDNPYKGFQTLAEAVRALPAEAGRDLCVVVLGDEGPTARLGEAEVRFVSFVGDAGTVAEYYRAADVLVHPSYADNLPMAPIEAMACGAPVVASSVGGLAEIVVDGATGLLVEAGDAAALSEALSRVLADSGMRSAMGEEARKRAVAVFSLEKQVSSYLEWYGELVSESTMAEGSA